MRAVVSALAMTLVALVTLVTLVTLTAATASAQGADHRWRFDETGSVASDTGSGPAADGDLGPGAMRVPGVIGTGAIAFAAYDPNGYVNMPASVSAFGTSDFTISFWVLKTPSARFGELVGTRGGFGSLGNYVDFRGSDTGVSIEVSGDTDGAGYIGIGAPVALADGQWHQITGVRSGPAAWLYYDGALVGAGSAGDAVTANLVEVFPFTVGANDVERAFTDLNCGCSFDDVRIYNRALSAFEIAPPASALAQLSGVVIGLGLPKGITTSLLAKLGAAQRALARGDVAAAEGVLGAFLNEVSAQSGKALTAAQSSDLSAAAGAILAHLTS